MYQESVFPRHGWYYSSGALSFHLLHYKLPNLPRGSLECIAEVGQNAAQTGQASCGHRLHCFLCSGP